MKLGRTLLMLLWLGTPGVVLAQATWTFDDLMANLAKHPAFVAEFEELRSSFFFSKPVRITGTLKFVADEVLVKEIKSPFSELITINQEAVVIKRVNIGGKEEIPHITRYSLKAHPEVDKAVNGVSNIFSGDSTLLNEQYHWKLTGTQQAWSLMLTPKGEKLAEFIASIEVRGYDGIINYIHSIEADDDESKMTFISRREGSGD